MSKQNLRWKAFRVGLGSLIDLRGQATYEAMQELMPKRHPQTFRQSMNEVNVTMNDELSKLLGSSPTASRNVSATPTHYPTTKPSQR